MGGATENTKHPKDVLAEDIRAAAALISKTQGILNNIPGFTIADRRANPKAVDISRLQSEEFQKLLVKFTSKSGVEYQKAYKEKFGVDLAEELNGEIEKAKTELQKFQPRLSEIKQKLEELTSISNNAEILMRQKEAPFNTALNSLIAKEKQLLSKLTAELNIPNKMWPGRSLEIKKLEVSLKQKDVAMLEAIKINPELLRQMSPEFKNANIELIKLYVDFKRAKVDFDAKKDKKDSAEVVADKVNSHIKASKIKIESATKELSVLDEKNQNNYLEALCQETQPEHKTSANLSRQVVASNLGQAKVSSRVASLKQAQTDAKGIEQIPIVSSTAVLAITLSANDEAQRTQLVSIATQVKDGNYKGAMKSLETDKGNGALVEQVTALEDERITSIAKQRASQTAAYRRPKVSDKSENATKSESNIGITPVTGRPRR
jgi:hypothetical protein